MRSCSTCKYTGNLYKHKCPTLAVEAALKIDVAEWVEDLSESQCTICDRMYPFHNLKAVQWEDREHAICRYCLDNNFHIQEVIGGLRNTLHRFTHDLKCVDCSEKGEDLYLDGKLFNVTDELYKFPSTTGLHTIAHELTSRCHPCRIKLEQNNRRTSTPLLTITCVTCGAERRKSSGCFQSVDGVNFCTRCAPPIESSASACTNCGHKSVICGRLCHSCCSAARFIDNRLCIHRANLIHPTLARAAKTQARILMGVFAELT